MKRQQAQLMADYQTAFEHAVMDDDEPAVITDAHVTVACKAMNVISNRLQGASKIAALDDMGSFISALHTLRHRPADMRASLLSDLIGASARLPEEQTPIAIRALGKQLQDIPSDSLLMPLRKMADLCMDYPSGAHRISGLMMVLQNATRLSAPGKAQLISALARNHARIPSTHSAAGFDRLMNEIDRLPAQYQITPLHNLLEALAEQDVGDLPPDAMDRIAASQSAILQELKTLPPQQRSAPLSAMVQLAAQNLPAAGLSAALPKILTLARDLPPEQRGKIFATLARRAHRLSTTTRIEDMRLLLQHITALPDSMQAICIQDLETSMRRLQV